MNYDIFIADKKQEGLFVSDQGYIFTTETITKDSTVADYLSISARRVNIVGEATYPLEIFPINMMNSVEFLIPQYNRIKIDKAIKETGVNFGYYPIVSMVDLLNEYIKIKSKYPIGEMQMAFLNVAMRNISKQAKKYNQ